MCVTGGVCVGVCVCRYALVCVWMWGDVCVLVCVICVGWGVRMCNVHEVFVYSGVCVVVICVCRSVK